MKWAFVGFVAAVACSSACNAAEPTGDACHAAAHVITETMADHAKEGSWIVDDPRYVTVDDQETGGDVAELVPMSPDEWRKGWRGDKPSLELIASPAPSIDQKVTECAGLRTELLDHGVEFGRSATERRDAAIEKGLQVSAVLQISTPILTRDGREALVNVAVFFASGGYGEVLHLRRSKSGKWKTTARRGLWIS